MFKLTPIHRRIGYHILFWVTVTLFFDSLFSLINSVSLLRMLKYEPFIIPSEMFAVYITLYFLLPRLAFKKRLFQFALGFLITLGFSVFVLSIPMEYYAAKYVYAETNIREVSLWTFTQYRASIAIVVKVMIVGIAVGIKLVKTRFVNQQLRQELMSEKLEAELKLKETELKFLRSQINPHFLFNSLNNLYGLTLEKSDKAPQVVLKISSLLDYMLYDCRDTFIDLKKDIENLKVYYDLQKLRFGEDVKIDLSIEGDLEGKKIAPLLILPLVENAFKHGLSENIGEGWVKIKMRVDGKVLHLDVDNSKPLNLPVPEKSGIGLKNVRKRLELQYKDRYQLQIEEKNQSFHVELELHLI